MHYFKLNIGDYHKKAGRLSMLQHGAYMLLMHSCYDREKFPTMEEAIDWCWASSDDEISAVKFVLEKFFDVVDGHYCQARMQEEMENFQKNSKINKKIALAREEDKRSLARTVEELARTVHKLPRISTDRHGSSTNEHEPPPNQEPITKNQEEIQTKILSIKKAIFPKPDGLPDVVWNSWVEHRKRKKAAISQLVISNLEKSGAEIGWSLEQVMEKMVVNNWQGFDATWIRKPQNDADESWRWK